MSRGLYERNIGVDSLVTPFVKTDAQLDLRARLINSLDKHMQYFHLSFNARSVAKFRKSSNP